MPLVVIDINGGPGKLEGILSRRMLKIRPGIFVGNLSKRSSDQLWQLIESFHPKSAAIVYPTKNELGFFIKQFGVRRYYVDDNYGLPLISVCINGTLFQAQ